MCVFAKHAHFVDSCNVREKNIIVDTERQKMSRKSEHSSRQMKQRDCLTISFFLPLMPICIVCLLTRFTVFITGLSSHGVLFWGIWCVSVCVCAFCCRFKMYFSKMNDIYRNRNAPKVLHACAHSATFSFSQVSCFLSFAVVFLLCFAPHHSIDPVLIATQIVSACACMHMRMRKRTTENHLSAHGRSRKQNRNNEKKL